MREIKNRTKIFIAGSRSVSRLGKDVKERIDNIVDKGLAVIVGDANGIDKAVQRYLDERRYRSVTVFCMEGGCRNNVGQWPMEKIAAATHRDATLRTIRQKIGRWLMRPTMG